MDSNSFPEITIITPTHNREELIKLAIESVLGQTFQNWEYIIVDDASTDNTKNVVNRYNDERIKYISYTTNRGNAYARNIGVKHANSDLITFLDSDDEYLPNYLKTSLEYYNHFSKEIKNFGMLWGGTISCYYDNKNNFLDAVDNGTWEPKKKNFFEELKIGTGCGVILRKDLVIEAGMFDEKLRVAVDTDFFLRYQKYCNYAYYRESLVKLHHHQGNRVHKNHLERAKSYDIIFNKHKEIKENKAIRNQWAFNAMLRHYKADNISKGNEYFSLISSPGVKLKLIKVFFNIIPKKWSSKIFSRFSKLK